MPVRQNTVIISEDRTKNPIKLKRSRFKSEFGSLGSQTIVYFLNKIVQLIIKSKCLKSGLCILYNSAETEYNLTRLALMVYLTFRRKITN